MLLFTLSFSICPLFQLPANKGRPWLLAAAFGGCESLFMVSLLCVHVSRVAVSCVSRCACLCVCGCVRSAAGRQAAIKFSLSWPTLLPSFPQLAWTEPIRSNASHSSHLCMISTFAIRICFCFDMKEASGIFPQLCFFWSYITFAFTVAESAKTNCFLHSNSSKSPFLRLQ